MYKRIIQKYFSIVFLLFSLFLPLSSPCFAHFTHDIISYTMSSYLHDQFEERKELWESRQVAHLITLKEQKQKEMEKTLKKEREKLGQLPRSLHEVQDSLNASIRRYNELPSQLEGVEQEKQRIQEEYNKTIQKIREREELERQVVSLAEDINVLIRAINKEIRQLTDLETEERALKSFYGNKEYLNHSSIVQFKIKWEEWKQNQDREYEAQAMSYNNKVKEFEEWEQNQKQSIEQQRTQIKIKQEELDQLVQATNVLVSEYNVEREKECKTKECEDALLNKRDKIAEQRTEVEQQKQIIDNLISEVDEQESNYNEERKSLITELNVLRQNVETFSQRLSEENIRRTQQWEGRIRIQEEQARENWERAQEQLNQFQAMLKVNYGDNFSQFVEQLSHWNNVNQVAFTNLAAKSISQQDVERMQTSNNNLCGNHPDTLAARVRTICTFTKRVANLLGSVSYSGVAFAEWTELLKQKEQEIADIKQELSKLDDENKKLKSQWDTQIRQYNEQHSERQAQYTGFSEQLGIQLNEQIQQIQEDYNRKHQLLVAEYELISYLLFVPNSRKEDTVMNKKWADFESARTVFLSNIPEDITFFSPEFMQTNELVSSGVEQDYWSADALLGVTLSSAANEGGNYVKLVEEEEKKQVVFSWMKTKMISEFLRVMMDRISEVFSAHDQMENEEDFIEQMFLESVYQFTPVQQVVENNLIRYQITYDDRVFWILPEGELSVPKGVYQ